MKIIEQKSEKKNIKDAFVPILLVLAVVAIIPLLLIFWSNGNIPSFVVIFLIFALAVLIFYIVNRKDFPLISSLLVEVVSCFVFVATLLISGVLNFKVWSVIFFGYLILWFVRVLKLRSEWKIEKEKKWYDKWWFRFPLAMLFTLICFLFLEGYCNHHNSFLCNDNPWIVINLSR